MSRFEYKVVPAPKKGLRVKGARSAEARFAAALMEIMNELGAEGWEYQRSDTLPCEMRQGLSRKTTVFQNLLVFRREIRPAGIQAETARPVASKLRRQAGEDTVPAPVAASGGAAKPAAEPAAAAPAAPSARPQPSGGSAPAPRIAGGDTGAAPRLGAATGEATGQGKGSENAGA